jgi:hypothetical protein
MGELLTGLVPGLPGEPSAKVLERAEGVPWIERVETALAPTRVEAAP